MGLAAAFAFARLRLVLANSRLPLDDEASVRSDAGLDFVRFRLAGQLTFSSSRTLKGIDSSCCRPAKPWTSNWGMAACGAGRFSSSSSSRALAMFWLVSRPLLAAGLLLFAIAGATAEDRTAAELLPGTVVAYAELPDPKRIIDTILDHPLAAEVRAHPDYQQALASPQYERFQSIVKAVEEKLGAPYRQTATKLIDG